MSALFDMRHRAPDGPRDDFLRALSNFATIKNQEESLRRATGNAVKECPRYLRYKWELDLSC